nr:hypothetical protein [Tanacetum cinerariifolium]
VPSHDINLDNYVFDNNVQELQYSEQPPFIDYLTVESTSDNIVISYDQYLKESKNEVVQEQAFWLPILKPTSKKPLVQLEPVPKEIPHELPTISFVKDSFNKMRSHVNNFDKVITVRTKVTGQNVGTWGFEHIRCAFEKDVIPFAKTLKEYFQMFDQGLAKEITEMKDVFNQMETKVDKCSEIVRLHDTPSAIVSDRDPRFACRFWKGPEMIEVTNEKVAVAKEKLKEARIRQKSYADKHRRSIEFQPGDRVFLKAILDCQDRVMRNKTIPFVKILWRNHPEREATWETEESIRTSYPHFLP